MSTHTHTHTRRKHLRSLAILLIICVVFLCHSEAANARIGRFVDYSYPNTMAFQMIKNPVLPQDVLVYPNPTVNELHFQGITEGSKFAIVDMSGSIVLVSKTDASNSVDIHNLIPGYYIVRLVTPERNGYILKFSKS